jgi:hypothetical protein
MVTGLALLISAALPVTVLSMGNLVAAAITAAGLWGIIIGTLFFGIRGYVLTSGKLVILRLGWRNEFKLSELKSFKADPRAMNGAVRLAGNGGLFAFTGLFRNQRLGTFRAYATDPEKSVVLVFSDRTIVVTPQDPRRFTEAIATLITPEE